MKDDASTAKNTRGKRCVERELESERKREKRKKEKQKQKRENRDPVVVLVGCWVPQEDCPAFLTFYHIQ